MAEDFSDDGHVDILAERQLLFLRQLIDPGALALRISKY